MPERLLELSNLHLPTRNLHSFAAVEFLTFVSSRLELFPLRTVGFIDVRDKPKLGEEFPPLNARGDVVSAKRRRLVMLVCLGVSSLIFVGIVQQSALERATILSENIRDNVQQTLEDTAAIFNPGPPHVGIQIGHLDAQAQPEELARLRYNTGGHWNGINEVDINEQTALLLRDMLVAEGIEVTLLPATVPPKFRADVFLSLHADSSPDLERRGYKSAHWREQRNNLEPDLKRYIDEAYFYYTGLPDDDDNVSGSMLEYYAFNQRNRHAVSRRTPSLIVELGYISNPADLQIIKDPINPAYALKMGVLRYLEAQGKLPQLQALK